jgi:uroporphyrin-III C-methyltransferase/precorrin-2 dehydrogenase/sirohydrochlorin ferrochelatase
VYLVGAGPGDPDLLTFRALRLMQQCDVVLYDRLVSAGVMDLVRRDAERIFVGKARNQHAVPQDEINAELVRHAQAGKRVLRLKGGDPFIFGRGGEEIETLMAHGVAFQVVPGVTAASGCAAYAGIPLTHRDYAQSCIFVTGHARKDGKLELHWDQLARRGQTVVFYMGLQTLPQICAALVEHGLPLTWPAAVVVDGTSLSQQVITGTLGDLPTKVASADISRPSLLMVGEVVRLREKLDWFRKQQLR